ncbi:hypothetical protein EDEG_02930 [Edhazardia aedis USNM 41457]|uniref:Uncharacterized protein n=1 Tax=Edhazardia aedis (strain USNM 41457) TaxID=1003232 RepID=J9D570_EDHAE|nr:hypothetical protein EDEG_02930 [Edhazardia aedis USNM 41457]|eukprot:EJW02674.1 hypothetical protein EDEG_02930 [Edhazardia aedis USNM 41457]
MLLNNHGKNTSNKAASKQTNKIKPTNKSKDLQNQKNHVEKTSTKKSKINGKKIHKKHKIKKPRRSQQKKFSHVDNIYDENKITSTFIDYSNDKTYGKINNNDLCDQKFYGYRSIQQNNVPLLKYSNNITSSAFIRPNELLKNTLNSIALFQSSGLNTSYSKDIIIRLRVCALLEATIKAIKQLNILPSINLCLQKVNCFEQVSNISNYLDEYLKKITESLSLINSIDIKAILTKEQFEFSKEVQENLSYLQKYIEKRIQRSNDLTQKLIKITVDTINSLVQSDISAGNNTVLNEITDLVVDPNNINNIINQLNTYNPDNITKIVINELQKLQIEISKNVDNTTKDINMYISFMQNRLIRYQKKLFDITYLLIIDTIEMNTADVLVKLWDNFGFINNYNNACA